MRKYVAEIVAEMMADMIHPEDSAYQAVMEEVTDRVIISGITRGLRRSSSEEEWNTEFVRMAPVDLIRQVHDEIVIASLRGEQP